MNLDLTGTSLAHQARTLIALPALPKRILTAFVFLSLLFSGHLVAEEKLDFNRDIRPILSDNCFLCHGPAASTRAAELRLDKREPAVASSAITPGKPDQSELVERIFSDDANSIMPPPDANKKLTPQQKEILKRWIQEGAEYQQHWSFVTPVKQSEVQANSIDQFVTQKLNEHPLTPTPPANPETLIRRVTFDLNGVPPTPTEVEQFKNDINDRGIDDAYQTLVDRLLANNAYGERMALAWLDAARYGDSSVMHADGPRDMWPWRDWVINAYNTNMPFDRFTIDQIAGDLLPNATVEQKIASGFNRNHATSDEGGAFAEELRVEYVVDRVKTTSTVWLGLTMECSQCHDHKYDPISQEEYYQFFAYFNNTTDPGMQTRNGNQSPTVRVISAELRSQLDSLQTSIDTANKNLAERKVTAEPEFLKWVDLASQKATAKIKNTEPLGLTQWYPLDESTGNKLTNSLSGAVAKKEKGKLQTVNRSGSSALDLNGQTQFVSNEKAIEIKNDQPFSFAAWIKTDGKSSGAVFSRMDVPQAYRGYDMWVQRRSIGTHIINTWPSNALKAVSVDQLKINTWQHVVITYDGSQKTPGVKIHIDGKLSGNAVEADTLNGTIETATPFKIGSRSQGGNWKGGVDDIRIYNRALSAQEISSFPGNPIESILSIPPSERQASQLNTLKQHFFTTIDQDSIKASAQLAELASKQTALNAKPLTSMVMQDNPADKMRNTYILDRGQYDAPQEDNPITAGVPAALPPLPELAPKNRLGLAQWLTQPEHPLTARVAVNRYWMMLFGQGLVRTPGDFGAQGMPPTHPKLLDWLAVEFVESDWDVKHLLKMIVMSGTYRQSSQRSSLQQQQDPENLLLSYSPRFRLQGEFIRDQALFVSGLLTDQTGGASVKPYQPPNIWNEVSLNGGLRYRQDKGENLYRKSMYTYWKRSAPMPNMMIFDSPSREKCVIQRARTNTPLQALVTLNDPQFVEAARKLAERILADSPETSTRIDRAYQLCTSRKANPKEHAIIKKLLEDQRQRFTDSPENAKQLLAVGESPRAAATTTEIDLAAWSVICQMILNLDETLTRN
ncbi:DUF1553 domain-containing protein [bacterium]|nr:DUF1553 domain-containing protein [bacterium]